MEEKEKEKDSAVGASVASKCYFRNSFCPFAHVGRHVRTALWEGDEEDHEGVIGGLHWKRRTEDELHSGAPC